MQNTKFTCRSIRCATATR